jgi:hypothetical protein
MILNYVEKFLECLIDNFDQKGLHRIRRLPFIEVLKNGKLAGNQNLSPLDKLYMKNFQNYIEIKTGYQYIEKLE